MEFFDDDAGLTDFRMIQRVVDLFESSKMQKMTRIPHPGGGFIEKVDIDVNNLNFDYLICGCHDHCGRGGALKRNDLTGKCTNSSCGLHQPSFHFEPPTHKWPLAPPAVYVKTKESDAERKSRLLQEKKKIKNKAERKRLKKQKQKERKLVLKMEKDKQTTVKSAEGGDEKQQSPSEDDTSKDSVDTIGQQLAAAKVEDGSSGGEDECNQEEEEEGGGGGDNDDSDSSEELDLTSSFVSKAALIVQRKLEQKPRSEKKEKKKTPIKEENKSAPEKPVEEDKKDSATPDNPTFEDYVKISTELATMGNNYASAGDYNMAVKCFTGAIRYNPTQYKLFGNRAFCFERLQEYEKALTDAELSLSMCPGWVKGLFRKGRALVGLKRYEEAAQAFQAVLQLDSSCGEAAQELMRVQITQLMAYGFTKEQSSNALIIHGSMSKALEVLTSLSHKHPHQHHSAPPDNFAKVFSASASLPPPVMTLPSGPAPAPVKRTDGEDHQLELFPVWVGNLVVTVTEDLIRNLFSKVGEVYSVKLLSMRRCAFVNFTKQESCDEAIRQYHGLALMGNRIAVRYPDRIPEGKGISRSALRAEGFPDDQQQSVAAYNRRPYRPVSDLRGFKN